MRNLSMMNIIALRPLDLAKYKLFAVFVIGVTVSSRRRASRLLVRFLNAFLFPFRIDGWIDCKLIQEARHFIYIGMWIKAAIKPFADISHTHRKPVLVCIKVISDLVYWPTLQHLQYPRERSGCKPYCSSAGREDCPSCSWKPQIQGEFPNPLPTRRHQQLQVVILIPEVPAFSGDVTNVTAIHTILAGQYRTINRGGNSIYEEIRKAGYEPWVPSASMFLNAGLKLA